MHDPLHQFKVYPLISLHWGGLDLSLTNSAFFMILTVVLGLLVVCMGVFRQEIVPGRWQSLVEIMYDFLHSLMDETVGKKGKPFFPYIFALFLFILMGNLLGMIPYGFTFTSQIILTFGLAMISFLLCTLVGLVKHGAHYFSLFVPQGAPVYMLPLIVPIEIISYLSRPLSLAIRLFANMMAGHTMLKVFAGFTVALGFYGLAPLCINIILTGFEIVVAILQAYVFTILTCIYLRDALYLH